MMQVRKNEKQNEKKHKRFLWHMLNEMCLASSIIPMRELPREALPHYHNQMQIFITMNKKI